MRTGITISRPGSPATSGCGRVFIIIFCLIFTLVGSGLLFILGRLSFRTFEPYFWNRSQCRMISSQVVETSASSGKFNLDVSYEFEQGGSTHISRDVSRNSMDFSDYGEVSRLAETYSPGSQVECFVKEDSPGAAVLLLNSLWYLALPLFSLPFIGFGLFGLSIGAFGRPVAEGVSQNKPAPGEAISRPGNGGKVFLGLFLSIFMAIGAGLLYFLVIRPAYLNQEARAWPLIEAIVLESRIVSQKGDDSTSYFPFVLYTYNFAAREYRSNRYSFFDQAEGSGYDRANTIVETYPPGKRISCRVNPEHPYQSVIDTSMPTNAWIFAGVGLLFVILPGLLLRAVLKSTRRQLLSTGTQALSPSGFTPAFFQRGPVDPGGQSGVAAELLSADWIQKSALQIADKFERLPSGEFIMKPVLSAGAKLGCAIVAALIWNGVLCAFAFSQSQSFLSGEIDWTALVIFLPFAAIGLVLIGAVIYTALASRNPKINLIVPARIFSSGDSVRVRWELQGRTDVLRSLSFELSGTEVARYRRGTDTVTERNTFLKQTVWQTSGQMIMRSGQFELRLPEHTMHSFSAGNNSIEWSLSVQGQIDNWPDLSEAFPLLIVPAEFRNKTDA